ncbi:MAG: helix-turn-helix domain-containing protein [Anaerolineales bacterium]
MAARSKSKRTRKLKYDWDGGKVRALRSHMGLTQTEFAEELGTLQQTVSEWECGYHTPKGTSVTLLRIVAEKAGFVYGSEQKSETAS